MEKFGSEDLNASVELRRGARVTKEREAYELWRISNLTKITRNSMESLILAQDER